DMLGHAGNHVFRRISQALRPVLPDHIVIATNAAGGDDHGLGTQLEAARDLARTALSPLNVVRLEDRARDAIDGAVCDAQRIDSVAKSERQPAAGLGLARAPFERLDYAGAGTPANVKSGHGIAMAHGIVAAALGPADHRKNSMAHRAEPVAFLSGRKCDIGFRPAPRP